MFVRDIVFKSPRVVDSPPKSQGGVFSVFKRPRITLGIISACIFGTFFTLYMTHAQVVMFYASSCLGTWTDAARAQGEPDGFSDATTAKLSGFGAEIFCGSFTGEIPNDTVPKSFVLKFAWQIPEKETSASASLIEGVSTSVVDSGTTTPSTETTPSDVLIDATLDQKEEVEVPTDQQQEEKVAPTPEIPAVETPPIESGAPEVSPVETAPAPEPVSWLEWFIHSAFAQEQEIAPTSTDPVFDMSTASSSAEGISATTEATNFVVPESQKTLFEVYYTLDGSLWKRLGSVSSDSLPTIEFPLPLKLWSDLSTLQVRVVSTPTVLELPKVELDSMWVETTYDEKMLDIVSPPDFRHDILLNEYVISDMRVVKIERPSGEVEIWYRALREGGVEGDWQRVAGSEYVVERNSPVAVHSSMIFWANKDRRVLYGFHTLAGGYQSQSYNGKEYVFFDFYDLATERWQIGFYEAEDRFEFQRVVPPIDVQE